MTTHEPVIHPCSFAVLGIDCGSRIGALLVARWCGVKVLRFSVGFGKPLITKKFAADGTEWVIAAFPLGGYVKMLDEREGPS